MINYLIFFFIAEKNQKVTSRAKLHYIFYINSQAGRRGGAGWKWPGGCEFETKHNK